MFCTSCGKEIENGSVFCTHCGANQMQEETPTAVVPNETEPQVSDTSGVVQNSAPENPGASSVIPMTPDVAPMVGTVSATPSENALGTKPAIQAKSHSASSNSDVKKSNSSIVVFGILLVAVIVALFLLFGRGSGYKEYKDLVKDYYSAIYKEDFKALIKCYDKEDQNDMKDDKEDIEEELKDIKDMFDDKYGKGWNKKIDTVGRTRIDSDDGVTFYSVSVEIDEDPGAFLMIKKYKNKYYIDSSKDLF